MTQPQRDLSEQPTVYHLQSEHEGATLAAALKALCRDSTWGQVKKQIARRQVTVNGNLCLDEARRMNADDVIHLHGQPLARPVEQRDIRLVHLDEDLLVVDKPAGITTVRHFHERTLSTRRRQVQPTLEELLPPVLAKVQKLRWPPLPPVGMNKGKRETNRQRSKKRPGHIQNLKKLPPELRVLPVHRLDRDTSGLMLFARNPQAEKNLVAMFRRHAIGRRYTAICHGTVQPQTYRSLLVRDRGDGIRGSLVEGPIADQDIGQDTDQQQGPRPQQAITHVVSAQVLKGGQFSLVRCRLETGRTHQIRIHLSEAGHPICGDKIYHRLRNGTVLQDLSGAPRQALHSDSIDFQHPTTGEHFEFHSPLPRDLAAWLKPLLLQDDS